MTDNGSKIDTDKRDRFGRLPTDPMYGLWPAGDHSDMYAAEARVANARNEAERAGQSTKAELAEIQELHDADAALQARLNLATKAYRETVSGVRKAETAETQAHMARGRVDRDQPWRFGPSGDVARAVEIQTAARKAYESEAEDVQKARGQLVAAEHAIVARAEARQRAIQRRLNEEEARRSRKARGIPEPEKRPSVVRTIPVGTAAAR